MRILASLPIGALLIVLQMTYALAGRPLIVDDAAVAVNKMKRRFTLAFVMCLPRAWCSTPLPAAVCARPVRP